MVAPWGLQLWLLGWGRRSRSQRFEERARAELRSVGRILVRLRGTRSEHAAERELDDLLTLMASHNLRTEGMPRGLLQQALERAAASLRRP